MPRPMYMHGRTCHIHDIHPKSIMRAAAAVVAVMPVMAEHVQLIPQGLLSAGCQPCAWMRALCCCSRIAVVVRSVGWMQCRPRCTLRCAPCTACALGCPSGAESLSLNSSSPRGPSWPSAHPVTGRHRCFCRLHRHVYMRFPCRCNITR